MILQGAACMADPVHSAMIVKPSAIACGSLGVGRIAGPRLYILAGTPSEVLARKLAGLAGAPLPTEAGAIAGHALQCTMLAPRRWLLIDARGHRADLAGDLGQPCSLVDITDGRAWFEVTGPLAADLLAGATSIDLRLKAFPTGTCRTTHFVRAGAIIIRREPDIWHLIVDISLSSYVFDWLAEFAVPLAALHRLKAPSR